MAPLKICRFHMGRCGSTVTAKMLAQHPDIKEWGGEFFREFFVTQRIKDILGHVSRIQHSYGFEIKPFHLRLAGISKADCIRRLKEGGFTHFIVLKRENYLRKVASSLALMNRTWPNKVDCHKLDIDRAAVPRREGLLSYMTQWDRDFKELGELLGDEALYLTYEKHIEADPRVAYEAMLSFLGLPPFEAKITMKRVDVAPLEEMITNFEEVARYLEGTPYEWMAKEW